MAESANMPPEASPISVGLTPPPMPPGLNDITMTPAVATKIDVIIGHVTASPRKIRPKIATWIGSVFRYAMVTTNERSFMATSISAVAATWAKAPSITHGQKLQPGRGSGTPVATATPTKYKHERKAEQKPHMGGADRAQAAGQLALHRIAHGLKERGQDGEDDPQPRRDHYAGCSAVTCNSRPYRATAASGQRARL